MNTHIANLGALHMTRRGVVKLRDTLKKEDQP